MRLDATEVTSRAMEIIKNELGGMCVGVVMRLPEQDMRNGETLLGFLKECALFRVAHDAYLEASGLRTEFSRWSKRNQTRFTLAIAQYPGERLSKHSVRLMLALLKEEQVSERLGEYVTNSSRRIVRFNAFIEADHLRKDFLEWCKTKEESWQPVRDRP